MSIVRPVWMKITQESATDMGKESTVSTTEDKSKSGEIITIPIHRPCYSGLQYHSLRHTYITKYKEYLTVTQITSRLTLTSE